MCVFDAEERSAQSEAKGKERGGDKDKSSKSSVSFSASDLEDEFEPPPVTRLFIAGYSLIYC
jgi:hypothetical protein